ncbi:MAG: CPBP family intramembrane metalloprotease [Spirochaetia bacterium]|nr:CPBP family intramembrane metalloprotease [Spirochaetia bacterium]
MRRHGHPAGPQRILQPDAGFEIHEIGLQRTFRTASLVPLILLAATILGFLACLTYYFLGVICIALFPVNYMAVTFDYARLIPSHQPWRILTAFYFAFTAGFGEEIFFRGIPFLLAQRIGGVVRSSYVLWSAALFAVAHWEQGICGSIPAFLWGCNMALMFLFFRNLWPLMATHFLYDFLLFAVGIFPQYRMAQIIFGTGGTDG